MSWRRSGLWLALGVALILGLGSAARGQARPGAPVNGVVINRAGAPVGGLTVQLLHPELGPSFPIQTTPSGTYYFPSVPSNVRTPYVVEIRWGQQVIYRDYLRHLGPQEPIRLR